MSLARNPALWTGLALMAIGGGNWINGSIKLDEYNAVASQADKGGEAPAEFPHLNARTNATLLEPLRGRSSHGSIAEGKRDFYRVVQAGGRLLVLGGVFFVVAATYWERRRDAVAT